MPAAAAVASITADLQPAETVAILSVVRLLLQQIPGDVILLKQPAEHKVQVDSAELLRAAHGMVPMAHSVLAAPVTRIIAAQAAAADGTAAAADTTDAAAQA